MTLNEAKASSKVFLLASEAAPILGTDAQTLRVSARMGVLPFPFFFTGNRLKIPRIPLLQFLGEA